MIESLFTALGAGLQLWGHKDKMKYVNKKLELERQYYEEFNKDISDDAVLDNITFELQLLVKAFNSQVIVTNSTDK